MRHRLVITSVLCFVVSRELKSKEDRFWLSPVLLPATAKFTAQVYVLTKDEGGRHTPFFNNYRPQFYFRTTDVTGVMRTCPLVLRCACLVIT